MKYLEALVLSTLAVFAPIKAILLVTGALIMIDLVTGIFAAWKRKEPITSTGIKRTVIKCLVYNLAVITGFLIEKYLTDSLPFVKLISGLIGTTEGLSILENLNAISDGKLLKPVIDKLSKS